MISYELKYPEVWLGEFIIRGQRAPVKLHYVGGNLNLAVAGLLKRSQIKICQQVTTGSVSSFNALLQSKRCCFLTALPSGRTLEEKMKQVRSMKNTFGKYIKTKNSMIGMTTLYSDEDMNSYKTYIITPSEETSRLIACYAPDWYYSICDQLHFIVMISI